MSDSDTVAGPHPPAADDRSRVSDRPLTSLRIWPALLCLLAMLVTWLLPRLVSDRTPQVFMISVAGPLLGGLLILVWWLFLSRATSKERWLGGLTLIVGATVGGLLLDKSFGLLGVVLYLLPSGMAAFAVTMVFLSQVKHPVRTGMGVLVCLAMFGYWNMQRMEGVTGDFQAAYRWRWEPTAEETFLASLEKRPSAEQLDLDPASAADVPTVPSPAWPAFRGPQRDSVIPDVALAEDWDSQPPRELWRIPIGPGWGSFSVAGDRLFTQEQRGEEEVVSCYDADSGAELWTHNYRSRFWESIAGAGPRATPTLANGKLYALGAEGLLHCLDPRTGEMIWQADIGQHAERDPPNWGFASSPLVVADRVVVHAGGAGDRGVLAYEAETGELAWTTPSGDHSYSSPQLIRLHDRNQVLMVSNSGVDAINPDDGSFLWRYEAPFQGYRILQPTVLSDGSFLLATPMSEGTERFSVSHDQDSSWQVKQGWATRAIKPDYNDLVVHQGAIYGFDHNIFVCVDLETGERQWKRGRYGNGQVLLLPEGNQLLVLTEQGGLVLLRTDADEHRELSKFQALEGKTWNHPVLVGDRLYLRNAKEAVAFQLELAE